MSRIELSEAEGRGAFRAFDDDGATGSMIFARSGPATIIVLHTGVETRARGQGVARGLFDHMVAWARETETRITPTCPYTRKMFREHPETQDVLR